MANRIEEMIDGAMKLGDEFNEAMDKRLDGLGFEDSRVSDAEFLTWYAIKTGAVPKPEGVEMKVYPPEPWIMEDWSVLVASGWEMARPYTVNGKELLERRDRAMGKALYQEVA